MVNSGVSYNIQGQGGFAHARARSQYDQIRALKSGRQMVQAGKAGGDACQKSFVTLTFFQFVNVQVNQGADVIEGRLDLVFRYLENGGFCKIKDIIDIP